MTQFYSSWHETICKMVVFRNCFNLACFLIAFGMSAFWLFKYWKDEDLVQVNLKPFETPSNAIGPVLSICFQDPFIESKLKIYNTTLTGQIYHDILAGESSFIGIEKIDFDDVTLNLTDFHLDNYLRFRNGTAANGSSTNFPNEMPRVTYSGFWYGMFIKCFGLSFEYKNVAVAAFRFNSSVFPNSIRPNNEKFRTHFHLPNQFPVDGSAEKLSWPNRTYRESFIMIFRLQQVEVLRKRNKRSNPCISDALNYDEIVLEDNLEKVGCKAPHQKSHKTWKICDSKENMKKAAFGVMESSKIACTSASAIVYTYEEVDNKLTNNSDSFDVVIMIPNQYKEIVSVKAVDIHSAIGNSGGYIGLFLGNKILKFVNMLTI